MNAVAFLVNGIIFIAQFVFLLRFLLQASRADFYNPISQGIARATDIVLSPLRRIIPPFRNFDLAALVVAWLLSVLGIAALVALSGYAQPSIALLLLQGLRETALNIVQMYIWFIIILVIASFVAQGADNPALKLLSQVTDPLMAPARRFIPPIGMLDISPIVVILLLGALRIAIGG